MVRKKGVIGAIMAAVLLIGATGTAFAAPESADSLDDAINKGTDALSDAQDEKKQLQSNLSAAQAMKKELENAKTALTGDVVELDSQMSEVSNDLLEVQNLLDTKEAELEKTTKELAQAKIDVEKQYEDMKLRIKFMYENGTMSYIQILLSSGSFSELLNKAEYIEQVSEYDRNMLQTYQDNRDKITRLEKDLKDQKEVLEQVKGDVEAKQTEMAGLISDKQTEIEGYESDIQNKEEAIKEYEAMIAEQDSTIKALEASVAAAKAKRIRQQYKCRRPSALRRWRICMAGSILYKNIRRLWIQDTSDSGYTEVSQWCGYGGTEWFFHSGGSGWNRCCSYL